MKLTEEHKQLIIDHFEAMGKAYIADLPSQVPHDSFMQIQVYNVITSPRGTIIHSHQGLGFEHTIEEVV